MNGQFVLSAAFAIVLVTGRALIHPADAAQSESCAMTSITSGGSAKPLTPIHPTHPKGSVELNDHSGKVCQPFDVWLGTEAGTNFSAINSCYVSPSSVATCTFPPSAGGPLKIHCLKKGDAKVAAEAVEFYTGRVVTLGFVLHCR